MHTINITLLLLISEYT